MFGGVGKSAGWATILVATGVVLGGSVTAQAADLGGDCCADLEERIAELEATTARKGNRKVSLKISGWVNEAVFFWDDGTEQNAYVGTNGLEQTRFKFSGDAKINNDWSAGYTIEIGVKGSDFGRVQPGQHRLVQFARHPQELLVLEEQQARRGLGRPERHGQLSRRRRR